MNFLEIKSRILLKIVKHQLHFLTQYASLLLLKKNNNPEIINLRPP
jgi:hypothetical protein